MRILVVPKWYPWPERPVFGIFCQEQARAISLEHDVVVLASDAVRRPEFALYARRSGIERGLRTLRVRYRRPSLRAGAIACQSAGLLAALRQLRAEGWVPDIVHAHVYSAGLPGVLLGRRSGAPVVISEHYTGFSRGLITGSDRLTARAAFRMADLVAPVSEDLAAQVRALAPSARVRVVENVVDTNVFFPADADADADADAPGPAPVRPAPGRPVTLLSVATLSAKKGHRHLLAALALVRAQQDVVLDIVGDGELRAELEQQVSALRLEEVVRFHGELSQADVAAMMREADLFVLPSLHENLPCVLIEAMASGLPAVATAVGGVPDLITSERAGALCPAGDSEALAAAILATLARVADFDPRALADRAARRFGFAAMSQRWSEIYEELLSARAGKRWMNSPSRASP